MPDLEPPSVTGSRHLLSFDKLDPESFERLCLWLVAEEGFRAVAHYGRGGRDSGRDVVGHRPSKSGEELWYFQCKRTKRLPRKELIAEIGKVLRHAEVSGHRPHGIVFVASCTIGATARDAVVAACTGNDLACEFWSVTELDRLVKRHPRVVEEFFLLPAGQTLRDQAEQPLNLSVERSGDGVRQYLADMLTMMDVPPAWHRHRGPTLSSSLTQRVRLSEARATSASDEPARVRHPGSDEIPENLDLHFRFKRGSRRRTGVDWTAARGLAKRTVVLGDPGYGKSWLLRSECHRIAAEALEHHASDTPPALPLLVPLRVWAALVEASQAASWLEQLVDAGLEEWRRWRQRSGSPVPGGLSAAVAETFIARLSNRSAPTGGVCLLLDGWDEVYSVGSRTYMRAPITSLANDVAELDGCRLILTSRTLGYAPPFPEQPGDRTWTLLPMDGDATRRLIRAWIPDPVQQSEIEAALAESASLRQLAQIPLLCAFLCIVCSSGPLPENRPALYERLLVDLLSQEWRLEENQPGSHLSRAPATVALTMRLLEELALRMAGVDRAGRHVGGWRSSLLLDELDGLLGELPDARRLEQLRMTSYAVAGKRYSGLAWELCEIDGVLVAQGLDGLSASVGGSLTFLHRSVHEYLVARALTRAPRSSSILDLIRRVAWMSPEWVEVVPMLIGRLHGEDAELARRCFDVLLELVLQREDPFQWTFSLAGRSLSELPRKPRSSIAEPLIAFARDAVQRELTSTDVVCLTLATIASDDSLGLLKEFLLAPERGLRASAAAAIANVAPPRLLDNLIAASDPDEVRHHEHAHASILQALAGYEDPRILERAREALKVDPMDEQSEGFDDAVVFEAVALMLRHDRVQLLQLVNDGDCPLVRARIATLRQIYEAEAKALVSLALSPDPTSKYRRNALNLCFLLVIENFADDVAPLENARLEATLLNNLATLSEHAAALSGPALAYSRNLRRGVAAVITLSSSGQNSVQLAKLLEAETDPDVVACFLRSIARAPHAGCNEYVVSAYRRTLAAFEALIADPGDEGPLVGLFHPEALQSAWRAQVVRNIAKGLADREAAQEADTPRRDERVAVVSSLLGQYALTLAACGADEALELIEQMTLVDRSLVGAGARAFTRLGSESHLLGMADAIQASEVGENDLRDIANCVYDGLAGLAQLSNQAHEVLLSDSDRFLDQRMRVAVAHPTPDTLEWMFRRMGADFISTPFTYFEPGVLAIVLRLGVPALDAVLAFAVARSPSWRDERLASMLAYALRWVASDLDPLQREDYRRKVIQRFPGST